jgi:hypothetical protein
VLNFNTVYRVESPLIGPRLNVDRALNYSQL